MIRAKRKRRRPQVQTTAGIAAGASVMPPAAPAAAAAALPFDAKTAAEAIRKEHASIAKSFRPDDAAENTTWTVASYAVQSELCSYNAWALAKYHQAGAPLHPVKIAEYVKEFYGKKITDGKWIFSTAQQHLVRMGFIWRHMLASDEATRDVQNSVSPPYPEALNTILCVSQAMSLAASTGARVHALQPVMSAIEIRLRRGDMLKILEQMRSTTPTLSHLTMEASLALSAMFGYRGNSMRAMRAVHLLIDTIEVGEKDTYAVLCVIQRQAKKFSSSGTRDDRRGGALRHRNIALCGIGRLALLWMLYGVVDETHPGLHFEFDNLKALRKRPVFADSYSKKAGYTQPAASVAGNFIEKAKREVGLENTDKLTHLGRLAFAKKCVAADVDESETAQQGGWTTSGGGQTSKVFQASYNKELRHRPLKAAAGVSPQCTLAEYDACVPRSALDVPKEVLFAAADIFIPSALAYENEHRGKLRAAGKKNKHLEGDRLVKLLKYLLIVMLTDAPFHLARGDKHPLLQHRFFATELWKSFAESPAIAAVFDAVARDAPPPVKISSMLNAAIATPLRAIAAATDRVETQMKRLQSRGLSSSSSSSSAAAAATSAPAPRAAPTTSTTGDEIPFIPTLTKISCATEGGSGGFQRILSAWISGHSGRTPLRDIDFGRPRDRTANDNMKLNLFRRLFDVIRRRAQSLQGGASIDGTQSPSFCAMRGEADRKLLIAAKKLDVMVNAMRPRPNNMRAFMTLVDAPGARTRTNAQRGPFHDFFPRETRRSKLRKKKAVAPCGGAEDSSEDSSKSESD